MRRDVVGWPALAGAAYDQGRAPSNAIVAPDECYPVEEVATGIYTIPEISTLGKTEAELTAEKVPYEVGKAFFKNTARAQITGERVGMLKLIFHFDTLELLGIHCFGDQASDGRIFSDHHFQLPDHGRSLPNRRTGRVES